MSEQTGEKTEQPTQRHLKKAREEGNFPTARVFVGALQFLAFVSLIHAWGFDWLQAIRNSMAALFQHALDPRMTGEEIIDLILDLLKHALVPLACLGAALIAITLAVQLGVTRLGATRWIDFGPFSIQPSEIAKLGVLVMSASRMSKCSATFF